MKLFPFERQKNVRWCPKFRVIMGIFRSVNKEAKILNRTEIMAYHGTINVNNSLNCTQICKKAHCHSPRKKLASIQQSVFFYKY